VTNPKPSEPFASFGQHEHEESVVRAFFLPERKSRYLEILSKPKQRSKLTLALAHFKHLNPKFVVPITPRYHDPESVRQLLVERGAMDRCWVISENSDLDARTMPLDLALHETVGHGMGTILSCVPGKLAYFEDEEGRCILQR
jgi:hypothetical protein